MIGFFYALVIIPILYEFYKITTAKSFVKSIKDMKEDNRKLEEIDKKISEVDVSSEFAIDEIDRLKLEREAQGKIVVEKFNNSKENPCMLVIIEFFYMIWACIGMFTEQWPLFFLLIVLGFIVTRFPISVFRVRLDSIVSIILLFFIIVNAYHLHIDLQSLMFGWMN